MEFVTVRDLRTRPKSVWETLDRKKEIIVTNNGKPSALMLPISEDDLEDVLSMVRQVNAQRAVSRMQRAAVRAGLDTMTLDEINTEIAEARKAARS